MTITIKGWTVMPGFLSLCPDFDRQHVWHAAAGGVFEFMKPRSTFLEYKSRYIKPPHYYLYYVISKFGYE